MSNIFLDENPICTLTLSVENLLKKITQSVETVKLFHFGILFMILLK